MKKIIALTLVIITMALSLTACGGGLSGTWVADSSNNRASGSSSGDWVLELSSNGDSKETLGSTWIFRGKWSTSGNKLTINIPSEGAIDVYTYNVSGSTLTLESSSGTTTFNKR